MKITKQQKATIARIMEEQDIQVFFFPEFDCTIALRRPFPKSDTAQVSIAIKGKDESRFKKSVGRYLVVANINEGVYMPYALRENAFYNPYGIAQYIASCFGRIN